MNAEIIIQREEIQTLANYIISQYTTDGVNGIYYHDADLENGAGDNSYRYAGANPNNYVCFGSTTTPCPAENLYRIIGVFGNEVKLIKSTSYGNYVWDSGGSNTWDATTKPYMYTTLNSTYLNSLGNAWSSIIETHSYEVGGMAWNNSYTAKEYYDVEVGSSQSGYEELMKIGLMYVSDYGFAASPDYWGTRLWYYSDAIGYNWLYSGSNELTISRDSGDSRYVFRVNSSGGVYNDGSAALSYAVRPSFYLTSSTTYVSGSGAATDPIVIN